MSRKTKETAIEERKIILNLYKMNKSYNEIAQIINRSRFTVRSVIKRFKSEENLENQIRSGRPSKVTIREKRKIVNIVKKDPKTNSTEIASMLKAECEKEVSTKTVRRVLKDAGYSARAARRKPYISKINQKKRVEFAKEFVTKDTDFWEKIMFSDESKFNIFKSDGRILVWRKPNTEMDELNLQATMKHGGGGLMVWGCMASSGVGELIFIDEIMDKYVYLNILKQNLLKSTQKLNLPRDFYFQQDRDPKHMAYIVRQWIIYNTAHTLNTPPQSPDMNPIEHVWNELEKRIRKHNITSKSELKKVLLQEWSNIVPEFTKKLVHSMPRRLKEVLKRKGLPTKY